MDASSVTEGFGCGKCLSSNKKLERFSKSLKLNLPSNFDNRLDCEYPSLFDNVAIAHEHRSFPVNLQNHVCYDASTVFLIYVKFDANQLTISSISCSL
jgi:hypothetical protein